MINRRQFLNSSMGLIVTSKFALSHGASNRYAFTLGVASGSPRPDRVVL
jgi:phosphodiesterase/alkaline phosphatase D-like protein